MFVIAFTIVLMIALTIALAIELQRQMLLLKTPCRDICKPARHRQNLPKL